MNRKQRRANKVKAFESLGPNMVALPKDANLPTDSAFIQKGKHTKVRFPVTPDAKARGLGFERMWVRIFEGDALNGWGVLDNKPNFSNFELGQVVHYGEDEDGFPRYRTS
tara:strand:- start:614 stop:943 length:330 start_codon:yes stop_codon:yes gene_type:complete